MNETSYGSVLIQTSLSRLLVYPISMSDLGGTLPMGWSFPNVKSQIRLVQPVFFEGGGLEVKAKQGVV